MDFSALLSWHEDLYNLTKVNVGEVNGRVQVGKFYKML